jgi:UPF0755 protein
VFFRLAIRLDTEGGTIKHGLYELPRGYSAAQLLHLLRKGPNARLRPDEIPDELKLTVAEGLSLAQMAELFDDTAAFLEAASDPTLVERVGIEVDTLEGFLMPDTYFFDAKPTEREAVERMLRQFETVYDALLIQHPEAATKDLLELVTVASLVEEETVLDEERPLVAAVIYNRLKRNMALELDATLQYALGKYGQRMLNDDKEVDSAYNTYKNRGLPPGPISSPGIESLRAAMAPAEEDFLFFVSAGDGRTHVFSTTMAEHQRAVAQYRRAIAEQRRLLNQREKDEAKTP